jgi:pyruvate dehydrogenase complex dehydrogenase (E1) component
MPVTPFDGVRSIRHTPPQSQPNVVTQELPPHLVGWQLPPDWRWGSEGVRQEHRHYQEVVDALGRSLALVTAPDPAHAAWLAAEARHLAHRNHSSIPTTYHYWSGPVIAASDYMQTVADQIRAWVPNRYVTLGTDGFGRSDTRERLRAFFEVDRRSIVLAALKALADDEEIPAERALEAMEKYEIDPDKVDPWTV